MLAAVLRDEGDPETAIALEPDWPDPEPGPGEALVAVEACSMNHLDVWIRRGLPSVRHPRILGADGVGTVVALGAGAACVAVGDRVVIDPTGSCGVCEACARGDHPLCDALTVIGEDRDGTHAGLVAVPAVSLHPVPRGLSTAEAACFGLVFGTAWRMLVSRARVLPGEWVLIWGIGGGVATAALQIARAAGARVIVTSSSDAKLARAADLGAEVGVRHDGDDVLEAVALATAGRGADVVIETVGKATWERSIAAAARGGRIAVCGAGTGGSPPARLHQIFYRQLHVIGSTLANRAEYGEVWRAIDAGTIRPVVDCVLPFADIHRAHARVEAGEQMGKVVLEL